MCRDHGWPSPLAMPVNRSLHSALRLPDPGGRTAIRLALCPLARPLFSGRCETACLECRHNSGPRGYVGARPCPAAVSRFYGRRILFPPPGAGGGVNSFWSNRTLRTTHDLSWIHVMRVDFSSLRNRREFRSRLAPWGKLINRLGVKTAAAAVTCLRRFAAIVRASPAVAAGSRPGPFK